MSLRSLLSPTWWDSAMSYPIHLDPHFGMGLDLADLLTPSSVYRGRLLRPRTQQSLEKSSKSDVVSDKECFRVMLNVGHFHPREISVKTIGNSVVVHGKHEEKTDEHGSISREFTRRYMLPEDVEPETVTSSLTPDGILVVEALKKAIEPPPVNERVVPIEVQQKSDSGKQ